MSRVIPTRPATLPVTLALALIATGCDSAPANEAAPDAEAAQTPIRDSAGIVIVENARRAADSRLGWQVSPDPVLSIGTVGGTEYVQLHQVDDALRLRDGRIVVANAGSHRLLVFDDQGDYVAAWGQRGQGPGDFTFQKSLVWAVWGERVIVAPTDHYELRAYRPDGSLARLVRREHDVRSPTEADLDSYRTNRLRMVADQPPELTRIFAAALDALPLPESFPAISAIEVDLLGNLWVREYNLPEDGDRALWTAFDSEGVVMGFVETPPGLIIYEIGEDYILGKMEDELRVEYVRLWGLDRSG